MLRYLILIKPLSLEGEGWGEGDDVAMMWRFAPHSNLSPEGRGIIYWFYSFAQAETFNQGAVAVTVGLLQVFEQLTALVHHFQKTDA